MPASSHLGFFMFGWHMYSAYSWFIKARAGGPKISPIEYPSSNDPLNWNLFGMH